MRLYCLFWGFLLVMIQLADDLVFVVYYLVLLCIWVVFDCGGYWFLIVVFMLYCVD